MNITVVKEGNVLKIISSSGVIPDNTPLQMELKAPDAWDLVQLETLFKEDDEDWGHTLDALRLPSVKSFTQN
jgi:hypothetical protein